METEECDNLDSDLCADCGDELAIGDLVACSCHDQVCEDCYFEHGHYAHDTNKENRVLLEMLED